MKNVYVMNLWRFTKQQIAINWMLLVGRKKQAKELKSKCEAMYLSDIPLLPFFIWIGFLCLFVSFFIDINLVLVGFHLFHPHEKLLAAERIEENFFLKHTFVIVGAVIVWLSRKGDLFLRSRYQSMIDELKPYIPIGGHA